ncbi:LOW QUALITY PROTEIN: Eukaryotic/viral aspartic protease [Phytophthora megakarya]|uniref:Eukaryotic/viral aspartic protease n=1 Tax=Phytophthora megakarya TaxID=4795 RepID=A0A225UZ49_9STRA|nr:LOW QUALITY PROTEIN: Eukaryotic/viral aspartic protease [Phytophthora megakarya]
MSVYAYVGKKSKEGLNNHPGRTTPKRVFSISVARPIDEYARGQPLGVVDLQPGERRGYWKHYSPTKWYKQTKIHGKLNNRKAVLLLDTGAEVSILDSDFARDIGCPIDTSVTQECVGIRDETYFTVGKTRVKVTLGGNMVYYMDLWVANLASQNAILGMNFMVPAGIRIDTAEGTACLPDEVHIPIIGRRPLYGTRMHPVTVPSLILVPPGQTYDVRLRLEKDTPRLWVTRGTAWVTSLIKAPKGCHSYLRITNIGEKPAVLDTHTTVGWWTPVDSVPRAFGFVQPGSRKYDEWQNLAYGATSDVKDGDIFQASDELMTERREYVDLHTFMHRPENPRDAPSERPRQHVAVVANVAREKRNVSTDATPSRDARAPGPETGLKQGSYPTTESKHSPHFTTVPTDEPWEPDLDCKDIPEYEHVYEEVVFHEGSVLSVENLEAKTIVVPEVHASGDACDEEVSQTPEESMSERRRNLGVEPWANRT